MNNPKNIWFAVDEDGTESAFMDKPIRSESWIKKEKKYWYSYSTKYIDLPNGSIKSITGKEITWKNKPIKWKP